MPQHLRQRKIGISNSSPQLNFAASILRLVKQVTLIEIKKILSIKINKLTITY